METFHIDHNRPARVGFPEIIYGASKPASIILDILKVYQEKGQNALVTKLQEEKGKELLEYYPDAFFDPLSGAFMLEYPVLEGRKAEIAIVAAGTSDLFIVNEIFQTLLYLGLPAEKFIDVGVAGLYRILDRLETLKKFKVLIVVAGFEGALPTVIGGLLPQPIIAVPASVGYGVADGGKVALHTMLASCANGITVMNIDNGCGAALAAFRIINAIQ